MTRGKMAKIPKTSPIQKLAKNGGYVEGLEAYQKLVNPTSNDDRWASMCLWNLGRLEDAKIMFTKAKRRGSNGALIGLASICRLMGDLDESETHLNAAFECVLSPEDWVRALLERGHLLVAHNEFKTALEVFTDTLLEAKLSAEADILTPFVNQSLGVVYHLLGNDRKAKEHFKQALSSTNSTFRLSVLISQSYSSILCGDFLGIENELTHQDFQKIKNPFFNSLRLYALGMYKIIYEDWTTANTYFKKSVEIAEKGSFIELDCLSKLGICKIYVGLKQFNDARIALKRVDNLKISPEYIAARDLTAGVLWTNVGQLDTAHECLSRALEYYQTHEMARELGWTHLHFAVWHLKNGDAQAVNKSLEAVADIAGMIGGNAFLLLELRLISDQDIQAMAAVASTYALYALKPVLDSQEVVQTPAVAQVSFQVFGKPGLFVNGINVQLTSAAKTIETLAYLLIHPKSSLEQILTDVFEETMPKAARNNFHQVKHQFALAQGALQIEYERSSRTYSIKTEAANLTWDYGDLMKILNSSSNPNQASEVSVDKMNQAFDLYDGAFLAFCDNAWVREIQFKVNWLMIQTGLKVVRKLFDSDQFDVCYTMTQRLQKIDPLDENLNELLILASTKVEGVLGARHRITEIKHVFQQHDEELPTALQKLGNDLKNLN
jgi:tetratricopeptide (TPR) repeat protein